MRLQLSVSFHLPKFLFQFQVKKILFICPSVVFVENDYPVPHQNELHFTGGLAVFI